MVATRKRARVLALKSTCDAKAEASQQQRDMWTKVFEFLPPGHYLQVSSVSTAWRALYATSMQLRGQAQLHKLTAAQAMVTSVPLLQWAFANGYKENMFLQRHAARFGTLGVLQYAHAKAKHRGIDLNPDSTVCEAAAARGNLEMLQWARAQGLQWDTCTTAAAAGRGHLEVPTGAP
eukprot:TRINITY_DN2770_c0_g2_i1.p2 TRINITY_DN2770_c0_g2~~TRINITY_DN2770_c0_g2_i1.p2  ORF type:complete len:191 (+),score=28.75 TRINITY_DN2770_c0_g2_i1:45-575(+)